MLFVCPSVCFTVCLSTHLSPVVKRADNPIQQINHYPADKCWEGVLHNPPVEDLSGG